MLNTIKSKYKKYQSKNYLTIDLKDNEFDVFENFFATKHQIVQKTTAGRYTKNYYTMYSQQYITSYFYYNRYSVYIQRKNT